MNCIVTLRYGLAAGCNRRSSIRRIGLCSTDMPVKIISEVIAAARVRQIVLPPDEARAPRVSNHEARSLSFETLAKQALRIRTPNSPA
jgi:hypothetical protein